MIASLSRILTAIALTLAASGAFADDNVTGSLAPDNLKAARALVADRKWTAAIAELRKLNDPASADWNNLMGYALRSANPPDLAAAEKFYNAALAIEPKHRGALEYSGELYLMLGNLPKAEQRLATLDKVCFLPCEEYTDLKKAVQHYKATGKK